MYTVEIKTPDYSSVTFKFEKSIEASNFASDALFHSEVKTRAIITKTEEDEKWVNISDALEEDEE